MKQLPGRGRWDTLVPKLLLPAQLFQSPLFSLIVRLVIAALIGAIIALIPYVVLFLLLPIPLLPYAQYVACVGMIIGFLKGNRKISEGTVIVFEKLDQIWQAVPDLLITLHFKAGCVIALPLCPIYLGLYVLNHPQCLIRTTLKIIFNDPRKPADLYRENLWKKWVY